MDAFQALADPTRRAIVTMLAAGERAAGEIGATFTISAPAVSQHLKVLKDAQLVTVRRDAQRRIYRLNRDGVRELDQWIEHIKQFWEPRLDALEAALAKPEEDA